MNLVQNGFERECFIVYYWWPHVYSSNRMLNSVRTTDILQNAAVQFMYWEEKVRKETCWKSSNVSGAYSRCQSSKTQELYKTYRTDDYSTPPPAHKHDKDGEITKILINKNICD